MMNAANKSNNTDEILVSSSSDQKISTKKESHCTTNTNPASSPLKIGKMKTHDSSTNEVQASSSVKSDKKIRTRRKKQKIGNTSTNKVLASSPSKNDTAIIKEKEKKCRFLRAASRVTYTESVVVLANGSYDKKQVSTDDFGQIKEDVAIGNFSKEVVPLKSKKRRRKWISTVISTSSLPGIPSLISNPTDHEFLEGPVDIYVKPLIILDLNGILCHRIRGINETVPEDVLSLLKQGDLKTDDLNHPLSTPVTEGNEGGFDISVSEWRKTYREPVGHVAFTDVIARTDIHSFLTVLSKNFTLAVWSSAKKRTVKELNKLLFPPEILRTLLFVWGQEKCESIRVKDIAREKGETETDDAKRLEDKSSNQRTRSFKDLIFTKPLSKVFSEFPLWNSSNSLLVDDSPEKCPKFRHNCIHPPPILGLDFNVMTKLIDAKGTESMLQSSLESFSDEENESKQADFFQKLAEKWRTASLVNDANAKFLLDFLEVHGKDHMNWNY